MPPPVAVTVRVEVPVLAVDAAFKVSVLVPLPGEAMLVGANAAVTPLGRPLTDIVIADLNPFCRLVVAVTACEVPRGTVALASPSASVNVGPTTVSASVCVSVMPAPVPFNVTVNTPPFAVDAALNVTVLAPFPGDAILVGAKVAVTPEGNPVADNATADLKPPRAVVVTVTEAELPAVTDTVVAPGVSVKLGTVTVSASGVVCVNPPPVPEIVTVAFPAAAVVPAERVSVAGALDVSVDEEKCAVTPLGAPVAESETGALNPPCGLNVMVAVLEEPWATETLLTLGVRAKVTELLSPQLFTSRFASTDPSPVAWS